jgi:hypothetical protein
MTAIDFQPEFAGPIIKGTKRSTIRRSPKRAGLEGKSISLWTGQRKSKLSEAHQKLGESVVKAVKLVNIQYVCDSDCPTVKITSAKGGTLEANHIARQEGFDSPADMAAWFADRYNLECGASFDAYLIEWETLKLECTI